MPDIHWGYGFSIGGVAADRPGGRGHLARRRRLRHQLRRPPARFRDHGGRGQATPGWNRSIQLFRDIPSGSGKGSHLRFDSRGARPLLEEGSAYVVDRGLATPDDLDTTEARGSLATADPGRSPTAPTSAATTSAARSARATTSSRSRSSTRSSTRGGRGHGPARGADHGPDPLRLARPGLPGLHDYLRAMDAATARYGIHAARPPARLRARSARRASRTSAPCAPRPTSPGATASCSPARRARSSRGSRQAGGGSRSDLRRRPQHRQVRGARRRRVSKQVCVHRKGATRAFPPGHPEIPAAYRGIGQPVHHPRQHGDGELGAGRPAGEHGPVVRHDLPRRRPDDEPHRRRQAAPRAAGSTRSSTPSASSPAPGATRASPRSSPPPTRTSTTSSRSSTRPGSPRRSPGCGRSA